MAHTMSFNRTRLNREVHANDKLPGDLYGRLFILDSYSIVGFIMHSITRKEYKEGRALEAGLPDP